MANYLITYRGGRMADTDEERQAMMAAWGAWFGQLGSSVVDPGNPLAASATVDGDGNVRDEATSELNGYSVLAADDLAAASELAKGCPILKDGGSVDVYEIHAVM